MKKQVRVTIEKLVEINLPDELLTEDFMHEFSSFMFEVKHPDELFKFAAGHVAKFYDLFIDGLGPVLPTPNGNDNQIYYQIIDESMEREIES